MRILFCSSAPLIKELGAAKPILELAEELQCLGWECDMIDPYQFASRDLPTYEALRGYEKHLRRYLQQHAGEYDVVDYDHEYLPYSRQEFSPKTLMVARSVLLAHYLNTIRIPERNNLRGRVGTLIKGPARRRIDQQRVQRAQETIRQADLVNVSNDDDVTELQTHGILPEKIVVQPFGISRSRRTLFDRISPTIPAQPTIAFVGAFSYRKGANEFPQIVQHIVKAVPEARFRLLGTTGLFKTREEVLAHFPQRLHDRLEITPQYRHDELPELLAECAVGIFPSYVEGFPFGLLEMLAAALPVIAYHCPGPPMMLTDQYLVPPGDAIGMSEKVIALLQDRSHLRAARESAQQRSQAFSWQQIALETNHVYTEQHLKFCVSMK